MNKKEIIISVRQAQGTSELEETERLLVEASREMTSKSYAPYSGFHVGAVILLENGELIKGSNQENGAYPSGLCAERVAIFSASALHPGVPMKMIAISARAEKLIIDHPVSPCGACRQVMLEYEILQDKPIKVLLSKADGEILIIDEVKDLLPIYFSGKNLKKKFS